MLVHVNYHTNNKFNHLVHVNYHTNNHKRKTIRATSSATTMPEVGSTMPEFVVHQIHLVLLLVGLHVMMRTKYFVLHHCHTWNNNNNNKIIRLNMILVFFCLIFSPSWIMFHTYDFVFRLINLFMFFGSDIYLDLYGSVIFFYV